MESSSSTIPVIDLRGSDELQVQHQLVEACKEWGCFRLINHGVPLPLMHQMKGVVRSLLDLPAHVKARNVDVIAGSGYVPPNKDNPLYEALGLYDVASPSAVDAFCSQLGASPGEREAIECYSRAVHGVVREVAEKLGESMGVKKDEMEEWPWPCQFRINKYNFTHQTLASSASGVCTHTDSGFLTLLQEDDCVGGLEVMHKSSASFVAIHPSPGTFLINLGDIAAAWSNGIFYNVKHRVQCKEAAVRVSIALFLLGPKEAPVEPPPQILDSNNAQPRLYAPFTYEDYRKLRLSTGLRAGEALQLLRLDHAPAAAPPPPPPPTT
ncbi:hypothetical protein Scep_000009 [Stephania cephalantha]|uniref:2-oxoglutarate-dependent dioxygenase DAO n=1 Tax=Stephania cephalantha TaxID=152367 RepID=A0AAP0L5B5_9MAGN